MNFRKHAAPTILGFMIAPMVDVLLVILVFFILTWNFALSENELDVRVPTATKANEAQPYVGQVVINIAVNGTVIVNRQQKNPQELLDLLKKLSQLYPDQAVIVRGDQGVEYKHIVEVLDICRQADIWNVAFATGKPNQ
ncbi:MAG: biopolymer transporter ExbD [Verrucomicrobia bacterium]|nr:biopolymer transporter ExbD [Verrucomicrobiota bacterium]MBV9128803.1 biopolymer transporter ExbD [Verrucomicrobiota bacterium]MBV9299914.1 biopolymer transporter ExbD [Verrucomicrobiota bacterium]MBV9642605.1 biopolymer transporter ExbD [Verrucomicrobiota bacterium]